MTTLFKHGTIAPLPKRPASREDHLTFRGNVSRGRHGWLRLTPAYSLHVVQQILKDSRSDELVLEPFSGTGTTPVACAAMGIPCHALDINPFLVWIGNLKLHRFSDGTTRRVREIASEVAESARQHAESTWLPELHAIEKWWDAPVLASLAAVFHSIQAETKSEEVIGDLLRVAFCRTIIKLANVSFGHQSMSFKKSKDKQLRLLLDPETAALDRALDAFITAAAEVGDSVGFDQPTADSTVFLGDSRNLTSLPNRAYTRVITSPPYPNRMSYIRELRPYMYWLGFLTSGRQAGEMDWEAIGGTWGCATSNLNTWTPGREPIPFDGFSQIVSAIGEDHKLLGRYVHKYFEDMREHIRSLRSVLAPGALCHYVVGNSKFYGTMLPVEQIYASLFLNAGFQRVSIETIRKRSSKKELFEFIVHAELPASEPA